MIPQIEKFNCVDDIPEFPKCKSKEEYEQLVKEYLKAGAISKENLIDGAWYIGQSRSTNIAQWFRHGGFHFPRYKFSGKYVDNINHFQDDDGYDVFVPFKLVEI